MVPTIMHVTRTNCDKHEIIIIEMKLFICKSSILLHEHISTQLEHTSFMALNKFYYVVFILLFFFFLLIKFILFFYLFPTGDFTLASKPVHPCFSQLLAGQTRPRKHDCKYKKKKSSFLSLPIITLFLSFSMCDG